MEEEEFLTIFIKSKVEGTINLMLRWISGVVKTIASLSQITEICVEKCRRFTKENPGDLNI